MATRTIDLVADVGESFGRHRLGDDERILRTLSSANVACGFHAGDPQTMAVTVLRCLDNDVAIGAHPGFPDLVGFGRRAMELSRDEVRTDVIYQVGALQAFAAAAGTQVVHVSPHGRLGSLVSTEPTYALGVADAVEQLNAGLTVLTLPGELEHEARRRGLPVAVIGLADRAFEDDGSLVSRREPDAVLHDSRRVVERALTMVLEGYVLSRNGRRVPVQCDSLLLHGDNTASIEAAEQLRIALEKEGVRVTSTTTARAA